MARKAIQKAENICVKKFTKHCIEQTKLFKGHNPLWDGCKADIYTETIDGKSYIVELKHTTIYNLDQMKQWGAMMEKNKFIYLQQNSGEYKDKIVGGIYLRFLKDGWMAWDVTNTDSATLKVRRYERKAVKVSNRKNNTKNTEVYLLDWNTALHIYDYKGNNIKQQWLDETITKYPKITIEELKQRLQQNKTFNNE